ncbi:MAG: thermonuclease family protein [Pseudomonadota bacterium]
MNKITTSYHFSNYFVIKCLAPLLALFLAACDWMFEDVLYIYDADSLTLHGEKLRLHGIDAPEIGHRAACPAEGLAGEAARDWMITFVEGKELEVTSRYNMSFDRRVADVSVNGVDLADALIDAGHALVWDYDGGQDAPGVWCGG